MVVPAAVKAGGATFVIDPPVGFISVAVLVPAGSSVAPELFVTVPLLGVQLLSTLEYGAELVAATGSTIKPPATHAEPL